MGNVLGNTRDSLAALEALSLDGTGVTVNVLVPGGVTNTPMISDEAGFERDKLIQPETWRPHLFGSSQTPQQSYGSASSRNLLGSGLAA